MTNGQADTVRHVVLSWCGVMLLALASCDVAEQPRDTRRADLLKAIVQKCLDLNGIPILTTEIGSGYQIQQLTRCEWPCPQMIVPPHAEKP